MNNDRTESEAGSHGRGSQSHQGDGDLGSRAQETAEQIKQAAQKRVERARHSADSAREQAAKRVKKLGVAVKAIGETMRVDDEPYIARYAQSASDRLDQIATYLRDTDTQDVLHDAERFVLRRPAAFVGGAFLVGLATGRFLKSSAPQRSASLATRDTDQYDAAPLARVSGARDQAGNGPRPSPARDGSGQNRAQRDARDPRNGATT